jgi:hypothetical protein
MIARDDYSMRGHLMPRFAVGFGALERVVRLGFRVNQKQAIRRFHKPVYRWQLRRWAAEDGALRQAMEKLGPLFFAHRWHTPTWPYVEPLKDAQEDSHRKHNLLASERQIAAEGGRDYDDIGDEHMADRVRTIRRAIRAGATHRAEDGRDNLAGPALRGHGPLLAAAARLRPPAGGGIVTSPTAAGAPQTLRGPLPLLRLRPPRHPRPLPRVRGGDYFPRPFGGGGFARSTLMGLS